MRLAVFADIHANRQAFSACLDAARARGVERMVCLGDYVGYGADPEWTVDTVMGLVADGAIAVLGNHDNAVQTASEDHERRGPGRDRMDARPAQRAAAALPRRAAADAAGRGSPLCPFRSLQPARSGAMCATSDAARSMIATDAHVTFCGHIHKPALYSMSVTAKMTSFVPIVGRAGAIAAAAGTGSPCSARSDSRATAIRRLRS